MNYGLYLSASGALAHLKRQDVIANNLANVATVGFKPDLVYTQERLPERLEDGLAIEPKRMLEMLTGGLSPHGNHISAEQGSLTDTGNDLDVAIEGEGFLVVRPAGAGPDESRLTRDGRMTLNAQGELVMAVTGLHLLDAQDRPLRLDRSAPVEVTADGTVLQGGAVRGRIRLAAPRDARDLVKRGSNLLGLATPGPDALRPASGRLRQGHLESSAVDPIRALMSLVDAAKAVQANARMMQYHDHIMGQAINTMGRVA